jgi:hypothetical protein
MKGGGAPILDSGRGGVVPLRGTVVACRDPGKGWCF